MDDREILVSHLEETVVTLADSRVAAVRQADVVTTGVRVYRDGHVGLAGALGPADLDALTARAVDDLAAGVAMPPAAAAGAREAVAGEPPMAPKAWVEEVEAVAAALAAEYPEMVFSNQLGTWRRRVSLRSDRGAALVSESRYAGGGLLFKERGSPHLMDGMVGDTARVWNRDAFLEDARAVLDAFGRPADLPAGPRVPVVISGAAGLGLPLSWFAKQLEGRAFAKGATALSARRGEAAFAPGFTLHQTRNPDDQLGPFFDAEGTAAPGDRVALIDRGVVAAAYTDRRVAAEAGGTPTGAASGAPDQPPQLAAPPLAAAPGGETLAALLGDRPAVFVVVTAGGEATPEGDYAAPVQLALRYEGGRFTGRLPELALRANLYEALGAGFVGVAADRWPRGGTGRQLVTEMAVTATG